MTIGIFGKTITSQYKHSIQTIFSWFTERSIDIQIHKEFALFIQAELNIDTSGFNTFRGHADLSPDMDFMISIGGDGTFLAAVSMVRDNNIPIVGFNSGRLGFLADIAQNEIESALEKLVNKQYQVKERTLLQLDCPCEMFDDFPFALNEATFHKMDTSSMITIHTSINGKYMNSYWADGIIIATPTGSTAYSMSAGGPVVTPDSANFIITPIAPHNLTVRPMIVPDDVELTLEVEGRGENFLTSLDSKSEISNFNTQMIVKKAPFKTKVIQLYDHDFYSTLRNKLLWGLDKRN
ncbi:NAD kinase [Puteibacter caeruleilacunae]|nr:NAD kinase [Puteibacter caeruleilacunae]